MIVRNNWLTGQLYLLGKHHFLQYFCHAKKDLQSGQCWNGGGSSNKGDSTVMKVENVVKVFESAAGRVVALRGINLWGSKLFWWIMSDNHYASMMNYRILCWMPMRASYHHKPICMHSQSQHNKTRLYRFGQKSIEQSPVNLLAYYLQYV